MTNTTTTTSANETTNTYTGTTETTPELLVRIDALYRTMCDHAYTTAGILHTFTFDDVCDSDAGLTTTGAEEGGAHISADTDGEDALLDTMWVLWGYLSDATRPVEKAAHSTYGVRTEHHTNYVVTHATPETHIFTVRRTAGDTTCTVTVENTFTYTHAGRTVTVTKGETCTYTAADLT